MHNNSMNAISYKICVYTFAERQQLPAVPARAGAAHRVSTYIQRAVPARQQAHPH